MVIPVHPRRVRCARPAAALTAVLAALLLTGLVAPEVLRAQGRATVRFGDHEWVVDVADTPALQRKGLAGRKALDAHEGMLFLSADKGRRTFWMRGMVIPIDIVWLDNRRVIHIEHRVQPPEPGTSLTALPTYEAGAPANMVLEIPAGQARRLGMEVGDRLAFSFGG